MLKMLERYSSKIQFSELPDPTETWDIQGLIGEGTYGEIYSAVNKHTGEIAAVKVLDAIHEKIEEIEEEYLILRDCSNHDNMPKFYGLYLKPPKTGSQTQIWLVMELCNNGSVTHLSRTLLDQGKRLDEPLIAHILCETLKVLDHLHRCHVIHRDVKGHNILITEDGRIKLIDFGVSGHLQSTLDRRRTSVGTPYWMAPEVIACERQLEYNYDIRCDIWSVGITAIELAEGEPPLAELHPMRALFKIPRNPQPKLKKPSDWSPQFQDFIAQCLTKDFETRPFAKDLLQHPFIQQLPSDNSQLREKLKEITATMEQKLDEPDITTKKGQLKSHKKSRKNVSKTTDDLATLENLDEETIVSQLNDRYNQGIIYTYIGDILLAVNPFRPLPIYSEEFSQTYMNAAKGDNSPHIYAVADQSFQMMMHNQKNQCIVISGESGAGKTESANLLVQQLTQLGKAPNRTLEERILQVNPLMEAFGNAKTVINDNSSRFGKYLEMFFTRSGTVTGAKITEYLLEKSRVISQAPGEQNFHIFYYIHDGLPTEDRNSLYHLKENTRYRYIDEYTSQPVDIASLSVNRVKYKAIQHCFEIIGFRPEEVQSVLGVLSAILHTGNIDFEEKEAEHKGDACVINNMELVNIVSKLLGIPSVDLVEALTTTGMVARGELIVRDNSVPEALDARDAMAKAMYGRLFSWIVNRINTLLKPTSANMAENENLIIGLLDIFGFENFPKNSFEQLCINIANEQIQYYFNQHIFAWELQEYKNEGLEGVGVTFVDNRPLLDMFLMKPLGLLALLDEESHFPKATDMSLVEKFQKNIRNANFSRPKGDNLNFCIDHYAGKVVYDAMGFLEKNRDRLPGDVISMLRSSENKVIRSLFQTPLTKTGNLAEGSISNSLKSNKSSALGSPHSSALSSPASLGGISIQSYSQYSTASSMGGSKGSASMSMTRIQQTVATYFRFSLMDLLAKMVAGSPHFVRCIRPNEEKLPDDFEREKVTVQLRYTGVLETTRIRREGFSHRITFQDFLKRYAVLGYKWNEQYQYTRDCCYRLLEKLKIQFYQLGKTKVFLKYYHVELLARMYDELLRRVVTIQTSVRRYLAICRFHREKWRREKAAVTIQSHYRAYCARREYQKIYDKSKTSAIAIQKALRGFLVRKKIKPELNKRREAALRIQAGVRGYMVRKQQRESRMEEKKLEKGAIALQRAFRSYRAQMVAKKLHEEKKLSSDHAAALIQSYYRMWKTKSVYQQLQLYRAQRETQLIYFSQQVELYGNETYDIMAKNNSPVPTNEITLSETLPKLPPKQNIILETKKKEAEPQAPPPLPPPNVSEERLEHMRKMNEVKFIMPEAETDYYNQVKGISSSYYNRQVSEESDIPGSPAQNGSPVLTVEADIHVPPLPEHLKKKRKPAIIPPTLNGTGDLIKNELNTNGLSDFRNRLRKTNIDLSQGIMRQQEDSDTPQHDFRHLLRKTGRLKLDA
ncbi:hypothetical protein FSP39_006063 [Pinctada imbricata]|uniref:non-specific serine/threonine protein kinase n=1 Tax=Pinctada imbricata TaxID=66713 RepID=A0AA88XKP6_PINIB|nr:hypothetical protein FSP39_006063 [Pinctada imbricata]